MKGLSFSLKRAVGISGFKTKIAHKRAYQLPSKVLNVKSDKQLFPLSQEKNINNQNINP